ncbi:HAD family hydrolase [Endozoicomonas sp. OPT23]|uniref:HAD family hydrolase n=1 Tax=Endozoicomonas sp. OPT23 TaxID=2072845 RepID=UPI00129B17FF|nr:HAD-IA family hydrolase [Endozoicomonas sp. OPT23]MRI35232.1 HAD family hydrolase [Endozoicomonas sp. OPT23]
MTVKKDYSLIIFDWDGTLVDSVPHIVEALKCGAQEQGLPVLDDEAYKGVIGLSLGNAIAQLYPNLGDEAVAIYRDAYRDNYFRLEENPSLPFAGVTDGLELLKTNGYQMAVATGKKRPGLEKSMNANQLQDFFSDSRTADDAESKPHPMMLQQILEELQVPAEKALMVGDAGFDLQMAANAGIDGVAVTYGAQTAESLGQYDTVLTVDSFDQLISWLSK